MQLDHSLDTPLLLVFIFLSICLRESSLALSTEVAAGGGGGEFCAWETFNTSCPRGFMPIIQHALYGRMELGRCMRKTYGHQGCSSDVLPYLDRRCSGRPTCRISLPDQVLATIPHHPCPPDLGAYLEVSYRCLEVETAAGQRCSSAVKVSSTQGYLSNAITETTSKGSFTCPWLIKGSPGQRVRLTLLDFGTWRSDWTKPSGVGQGLCLAYAQVQEPSTGSSVTLCGGLEREAVAFESDSEEVLIHMMDPSVAPDPVYYLLRYEILGCGDPGPFYGATVKRENTKATVQCDHSDLHWEITCVDGIWVSKTDAGNCTEAGASWRFSTFIQSTLSLPQGVLIALILGIAVLIAIIIFAFGVLSLHKRKRNEQAIPLPLDDQSDKFSRQSSYAKEQYPMLAKPERLVIGRESDYATTLQRRLAVPPGAISPSLSDHLFLVSPSTSECNACPVHGTYNEVNNRATMGRMSTFKPNIEHIYESPKFERRAGDEHTEECATPFYHELEPDAAQMSPTFTPLHCLMYRPESPDSY